jgi:Homing endonuclease associated repeat
VTREEIIAVIKECAERLGHVPSFPELQVHMKVSKRALRMSFGTYTEALRACGLERRGAGYEVGQKALFLDWAGLVRKLGKVPTITDYEQHGDYSLSPMLRCYGSWKQLPEGMWEYAKKEGLESEWEDVLNLIARHLEPGELDGRRSRTAVRTNFKPRPHADQPMYGAPLTHPVLCHAPTNEDGVIFLFGAVAKELGFKVLRIQAEFPDCEAMWEVEPGRWQRVRIEFEYESRNFLAHFHPVEHCDLIVCWSHNWQNCPLEVLELRTVIEPEPSAADLRR